MNVAALLSGVLVDALRLGLPNGLGGTPGVDALASPLRVLILTTVVSSTIALAISALIRPELLPVGCTNATAAGGAKH